MSDADDHPEIRYVDTGQFIEDGYLQEVNRQFLHPLGLALELTPSGEDLGPVVGAAIDALVDAGYMVAQVWDYRDDPEGIVFADSTLAQPETRRKAENVLKECIARRDDRVSLVGQWVQRVPSVHAELLAVSPTEEAPGVSGNFQKDEVEEHRISYTGGRNAVDENMAVCSCGWKGTPSHLGSKVEAEAAAHVERNS